jgi:hypothetical protein
MEEPKLIERYLLLFSPWALSLLFSYVPFVSFFIAWLGSFYIFHLSYSGRIKTLPSDMPIAEQLMRPIFLVQIIFAGYMSVSPIFNFMEIMGWVTIEGFEFPNNPMQLDLAATCQRFYCLGHASYVTGLLAVLNNKKRNPHTLVITDLPSFLVRFTIITLVLARAFLFFPGLSQFYFQLAALSFIGGTMSLIFSFRAGRLEYIIVCSLLFIANFTQALLSGFKEPIIINVLVLAIFLYPFYKKLVLILFVPVMIALFLVLPTYNKIFRERAWDQSESAEQASNAAINALTDEEEIEESTTWSFLSGRLSEVQMFMLYVDNTPSLNEYYGFDIFLQSLEVIVPRVFWPSKPITESLVMERVYRAGVINSGSKVSAKPALVVDGYLSGGTFGVFLTCLVFGAITQLISMKAEYLFGGYLIGTSLIFSGLFQILWRGLSFEFLINSVVWSYVTMLLIYSILRLMNILRKPDEDIAN